MFSRSSKLRPVLYCIVLLAQWSLNCIVLYCIVLYCIVLLAQWSLNCIVLYCIVLYCIVSSVEFELYCIVLYCIVLYCIVLYCIVSSVEFENSNLSFSKPETDNCRMVLHIKLLEVLVFICNIYSLDCLLSFLLLLELLFEQRFLPSLSLSLLSLSGSEHKYGCELLVLILQVSTT